MKARKERQQKQLIRTVNQLRNLVSRLRIEKEVLVKDVETGKTMKIESVSTEKIDGDGNDTRYMFNCKKAGDGCVTYK